jgi:hypothetical protein
MKLLAIAFLFFWFSNPVSLVKSTKQEWKGGQGKSEGVNYKIQVIVKKSSDYIKFTSVKINDKDCRFKLFKNNKPLKKEDSFKKNDTLLVSTSITYKLDDRKPQKHPDNVEINYTYKSKIKKLEVTQFEKIKTLMYP